MQYWAYSPCSGSVPYLAAAAEVSNLAEVIFVVASARIASGGVVEVDGAAAALVVAELVGDGVFDLIVF